MSAVPRCASSNFESSSVQDLHKNVSAQKETQTCYCDAIHWTKSQNSGKKVILPLCSRCHDEEL